MRMFFQCISSCLILLLLASCGTNRLYPAVIGMPAGDENRQYDYSVQFRKKKLEGFLVVRRMSESEIRFKFTTYFGMSVFDYSFRRDSFLINSCIAPLHNRHVDALMANDFRILFVGNGVHPSPATLLPLVEKRTQGRGFLKARVSISGDTAGNPDSVRIHHPLLKLTMNLRRLENTPAVEELEEFSDSITGPDV